MKKLKVKLKSSQMFLDYTKFWTEGEVLVGPGVYTLKLIRNPHLMRGPDWYIFEGTTIGANVVYFRKHTQIFEEEV